MQRKRKFPLKECLQFPNNMNGKAIKNYFDRSHELTIDNPVYVKQFMQLFRHCMTYDGAESDITSYLLKKNMQKNMKVKASIFAKQKGIVAGISESMFFLQNASKLTVEIIKRDGSDVEPSENIVTIVGNPVEILAYERTLLNILQRMSGIATQTHMLIYDNKLCSIPVAKNGTYIAATRKTPWMWLDKKAVTVGGGLTHRLSLEDGVLIKDNHIDILKTVGKKSRYEGFLYFIEALKKQKNSIPFEIEVENQEEAQFLVEEYEKSDLQGHLIIMLDNFTAENAKKTIESMRALKSRRNFYISFELSGGVSPSNIREYANVGADVISLGFLTHSSRVLDMSLKFT